MPLLKLNEVVYTSVATAVGGRAGHVKSADGVIDLDLGAPGSKMRVTANPETLFAAGFSACFQGAVAAQGKKQDIDTSASTVTAAVSFGPADDGGFGIAVAIEVHIPDVDLAKVQELADLAHEQTCPYSKATRGEEADRGRVSLHRVDGVFGNRVHQRQR
jgi:osmotically inducible protein OsmC